MEMTMDRQRRCASIPFRELLESPVGRMITSWLTLLNFRVASGRAEIQ